MPEQNNWNWCEGCNRWFWVGSAAPTTSKLAGSDDALITYECPHCHFWSGDHRQEYVSLDLPPKNPEAVDLSLCGVTSVEEFMCSMIEELWN